MESLNIEVNRALEVIQNGGVILYPTDTVWGLGCDASNEEAVSKIFKIKERIESKSLVMLLPDIKSVFKYVAHPYPDLEGLLGSFDRPTTVIYQQALGIASNALPEDESVAIRIVKEPFCKMLLRRMNAPLISTSANISGQPTPKTFREIDAEVKARVDYIVGYRQDDLGIASPSRIIKLDEQGNIIIIRE